jgi:cytochrome c biogenesis protein CcmG, thiol:disulfide interchange protein DsbE
VKRVFICSLLAAAIGCASTPPPPKPAPGGPIDFSLPIWPTAQQHSFADDRGHIVVLDAWASWCAPCKTELPKLDALAQQWKTQGVRVYAVNIDTGSGTVEPFVMNLRIGLPILLDPGGGVLTSTLALQNMPTTWVFDAQGMLVYTEQGSADKIADKVNAMLAATGKP